MLGMKESDENRHVFRVREFGEDDGKVLFTKEGEERLDLRDDVAGGRNFHRLAGIEEGALHVHDQQRRLARGQLQRCFKSLGAIAQRSALETVFVSCSARLRLRLALPRELLGSPAAAPRTTTPPRKTRSGCGGSL